MKDKNLHPCQDTNRNSLCHATHSLATIPNKLCQLSMREQITLNISPHHKKCTSYLVAWKPGHPQSIGPRLVWFNPSSKIISANAYSYAPAVFSSSRRLLLIHYQETKTMPFPKSAQVAQNIYNQLVGPIPRATLHLGQGQRIDSVYASCSKTALFTQASLSK